MADPTVTQQAIAAQVVLLIKATMAPVLAQMAALEQANKDLTARLLVLSDVRDRVVAMETKAAIPPPLFPVVDVGPMNDRVTAVEARVSMVETKAAAVLSVTSIPEPIDLTPVVARIAAAEARLDTLGDVRDRVVAMETKSITKLDLPGDVLGEIAHLGHVKENHVKEIGTIRERIAAVEVRAQVPGPPGKDGTDGKDGQHGHDGTHGQSGKDGSDGMGWDDLVVVHDGERTFTIRLVKGERVKDVGTFTVPMQIYRGYYQPGRTYEPGDTITYAKSLFHCLKTTVLKPDGSTRDPVTGEMKGQQGKDAWTLAAYRGSDGKDGKDAPGALPIVSVRPR